MEGKDLPGVSVLKS